MYTELKKKLTDAISDTSVRAATLKQIQASVELPTNLSAASPNERSVLCDNVKLFPFCVTKAQRAEYAHARAGFLAILGCKSKDAVIARGITSWHLSLLRFTIEKDPILMASAKHITARPEKDCPGWAALPADQKDTLRTLADKKQNPVDSMQIHWRSQQSE
jgi:hypothetical protein